MHRGRVSWLLAVGFCMATASPARAETAAPSFAVAAIKPSGPDSGSGMSIKFLPGGRLVARNATLRLLIKIAYNLNDDQLGGGPAWAAFKRFDIDAKPDTPSDGGTQTMTTQESQYFNQSLMRSLLSDRFQLKLRTETRDISLYALVVAKGGLKLTRSASADTQAHVSARLGLIHGVNATMDDIARELGDKVGHPVENHTGLDVRYDFKVEWTPDASQGIAAPGPAAADSSDTGPDLFTAVQQQMGLKLEATKSRAAYEVIESAQIPAEN